MDSLLFIFIIAVIVTVVEAGKKKRR